MPTTLTLASAKQAVKINALQRSLDDLHKQVYISSQARRDRAKEAHNRATTVRTPSFSIGDFVLVRRATDRGHKRQLNWCGTRQIPAVYSPLVYGVTSLQGGKL